MPATDVTIALRVPVSRLKRVDFPTLGLPTSATRAPVDLRLSHILPSQLLQTFHLLTAVSNSIYDAYKALGPTHMIKVDIVNEVSNLADITKVKAEVAVDAVFDAMRSSMERGERIELRGFGVFRVKPRKRGVGRNPRTGKEVRIPPGRTIRFKPGKDLQDIGG